MVFSFASQSRSKYWPNWYISEGAGFEVWADYFNILLKKRKSEENRYDIGFMWQYENTMLLDTKWACKAWAELQTHGNMLPMSQLCVPVASSSLETET